MGRYAVKICSKCRKPTTEQNLWTDTVCKYCWQKSGKTIYAYDLRDTSQYRNNKERKRAHHKRNEMLRDLFKKETT